MNNEEIKNEFINCIEGSHTLNLAISILEDREELQNNWNKLKEWLKEYSQLLEYKPDSYEETMRDLIFEIIDKMQEIEGETNE